MTKTRIKKISSLAFAVVIVVCTFLFTATSASASEDTPQPASDLTYENCDVYIRADVYPIVVHYVVYKSNGNNSLTPQNNIAVEEHDVTINSASEYVTLPVYNRLNAYFRGAVITSIKCQGYSPANCSVNFDASFGSWEGNLLTVNKFDKSSTYFNGYAVEDTSSKTIDISFLGGYDNGYSDGYEKGVQDGYDTGYDYGFRLGQAGGNNSNTDTGTTDTDTTVTDNEDWKTVLGIGAVLILLSLIILGVSKVSKEIK